MAEPIENAAEMLARARVAVGRGLVGIDRAIDDAMLGLLAGGHVLFEGDDGTGKASLVRAFAATLGLRMARVGCTEDLTPTDLTGTRTELTRDGSHEVQLSRGPLFAQLLLLESIHRAPARVRSTVFDAMDERRIWLGGDRLECAEPFVVIATQPTRSGHANDALAPDDADRFVLTVAVPRPDPVTTVAVLARAQGATPLPPPIFARSPLLVARAVCHALPIESTLLEWTADALRAFDPHDAHAHPRVRQVVARGPTLRAGQSIVLAAKAAALVRGANAVRFEDIERVMLPVLRSRLSIRDEAVAAGVTVATLLDEIMPPPLAPSSNTISPPPSDADKRAVATEPT